MENNFNINYITIKNKTSRIRKKYLGAVLTTEIKL